MKFNIISNSFDDSYVTIICDIKSSFLNWPISYFFIGNDGLRITLYCHINELCKVKGVDDV
jgi:hypothetical protein